MGDIIKASTQISFQFLCFFFFFYFLYPVAYIQNNISKCKRWRLLLWTIFLFLFLFLSHVTVWVLWRNKQKKKQAFIEAQLVTVWMRAKSKRCSNDFFFRTILMRKTEFFYFFVRGDLIKLYSRCWLLFVSSLESKQNFFFFSNLKWE